MSETSTPQDHDDPDRAAAADQGVPTTQGEEPASAGSTEPTELPGPDAGTTDTPTDVDGTETTDAQPDTPVTDTPTEPAATGTPDNKADTTATEPPATTVAIAGADESADVETAPENGDTGPDADIGPNGAKGPNGPDNPNDADGPNGSTGGTADDEPKRASVWEIIGLGTAILAFGLFLMYTLVKIWPALQADNKVKRAHTEISWFHLHYSLSSEKAFLLMVLFAGALGSFVHIATSFSDFVGNRRLMRSWTWFYVLRPIIGGALALFFYFAVRGGLFTTNAGTKELNAFGIAALAALAGLFSKQATNKLEQIFETMFSVPEGKGDDARADSVANPRPVIAGAEPANLTRRGDVTIKLSGTGFLAKSVVHVAQRGGPTLPRKAVVHENTQQIDVELEQQDVAEAGTLIFTVVNPKPGGGTSIPLVVEVRHALPVISSAAPAELTRGGDVKITLSGTGFITASTVQVGRDGAPDQLRASVTNEDAGTIDVTLAPQDVAEAGTLSFTVVNPAPGGGTSLPLAVQVGHALPTISGATPSELMPGGDVKITLAGTGFVQASTVQVARQGAPAETRRGVPNEEAQTIDVTLDLQDVTQTGTLTFTVVNPAPGGGTSAPFDVQVAEGGGQ